MSVEIVVAVQVAVMLYAVRSVCAHDRRRPSPERRRALRHVMWWALAVLIVAAALLALGQCLARQQRYAAACVCLQRALQLQPSAAGQLALAVNRGDAAAARAVLQAGTTAVSALQPSNTQVVCSLAVGRAGLPSYADYLHCMQQGPVDGAADAVDVPQAHADWVRRVLLAFERFRILCAVHQGDWGTEGLNAAVQKALADQGWIKPQGEWFAGRPVMVTRNDAQLGVFNGDVGVVLPNAEGQDKVWFLDGEALRSVSVMRLAQVETAFVMTVHKSQGSEFEHTALVLPPGGGEILSRELVYTGITRAREQFTLVEAEGGLLEAAIDRPSVRASGLQRWWA